MLPEAAEEGALGGLGGEPRVDFLRCLALAVRDWHFRGPDRFPNHSPGETKIEAKRVPSKSVLLVPSYYYNYNISYTRPTILTTVCYT